MVTDYDLREKLVKYLTVQTVVGNERKAGAECKTHGLKVWKSTISVNKPAKLSNLALLNKSNISKLKMTIDVHIKTKKQVNTISCINIVN